MTRRQPITTLFPYTTLFRSVEKWIDQQLHPERIAENAALEEKVKALETLKMAPWQLAERSQPPFPIVRLASARSEEHTLNSSHVEISYAVFCLKKKKKKQER